MIRLIQLTFAAVFLSAPLALAQTTQQAPGAGTERNTLPSTATPAGTTPGSMAAPNSTAIGTGPATAQQAPGAGTERNTLPENTMPDHNMPSGSMSSNTMNSGAGMSRSAQSDMRGSDMRGSDMQGPMHESLPSSSRASNLTPADTRSDIAPRLPAPNVGPNATVGTYLTAARSCLAHHQTGKAEVALGRAETELLQRSVLASQTDHKSRNPVVARIEQARQELGNHHDLAARHTISGILASGAPELNE